MTKYQTYSVQLIHDWHEFSEIGRKIREKNGLQDTVADLNPVESYNFTDHACWTVETKHHSARISAFYHPDFSDGFLGWFEATDDPELSVKLITTAEGWFREHGINHIAGPVSGLTWDAYRFNLNDGLALFHGEPAQPAFYVNHWKIAGFRERHHYYSKVLPVKKEEGLTQSEVESRIAVQRLKLIPVNADTFPEYRFGVYELLIRCFRSVANPYFTEISFEGFCSRYNPLINKLPAGFSWLVVDERNDPCAFMLNYPSPLNPASGLSGNALVHKSLGVDPDHQGAGLGSMLTRFAMHIAASHNLKYQIHALMYEDNPSLRLLNSHEPVLTRSYSLFEKTI